MDNATRHHRIAQRFLLSLLQQPGLAVPVILRRWADELEALAAEVESEEIPRKPGPSSALWG